MSSFGQFVLDQSPEALAMFLTLPLVVNSYRWYYSKYGFMTFKQHCMLFYKTGRTCHAHMPSNGLLYQITHVVFHGLSVFFDWHRKRTAAAICGVCVLVCGGLFLRYKRHPREQYHQHERRYRCAQFIFACSKLQKICKSALNGNLHHAEVEFSAFVRELYCIRFGLGWVREGCRFHDVLSLKQPSYIRDFYNLVQLCDTAFAVYPHIVFRNVLKNYLLHDTVDIIADYLYDFKPHVPKNSNELFERCRIGFRDCERTFIELMKSICE